MLKDYTNKGFVSSPRAAFKEPRQTSTLGAQVRFFGPEEGIRKGSHH